MTNMMKMSQALIFIGFTALAAQAAEPPCPVPFGRYAFTFTAVTQMTPPFSPLLPQNGIGIINFDLDGSFKGAQTVNSNGFIFRVPVTGTSSINADCLGSLTVRFPNGQSGKLDFVVGDRGKVFYALGVDPGSPGTSLTMTFTKMD